MSHRFVKGVWYVRDPVVKLDLNSDLSGLHHNLSLPARKWRRRATHHSHVRSVQLLTFRCQAIASSAGNTKALKRTPLLRARGCRRPSENRPRPRRERRIDDVLGGSLRGSKRRFEESNQASSASGFTPLKLERARRPIASRVEAPWLVAQGSEARAGPPAGSAPSPVATS
jgi:hypothetical protein